MTDLDFVKFFSVPSSALKFSVIIVAGLGFCFFRIARGKQHDAAVRYWKLLSLVAELCVAVGLIGLATFAGRMKIGADHQLLTELVQQSQSVVGASFLKGMQLNCEPFQRRSLSAYAPAVAQNELCAISRANSGVYAPTIEWGSVERSLREFPIKYPGCIENVFTRNSDCEHTVALATRIADDIRAMEVNKSRLHQDESMSEIIQRPDSSNFLLMAFLIAAIGVAIKCSRAASEFFGPAKSVGK